MAEHPFDGSWGYQVAGHFAPTSRFGTPQDFMYFVDQCHQHDIGVIVDWVPGHFPKDAHGLAFFDGSHLYEHSDPRKGRAQGLGYARASTTPATRCGTFLISNALFWFDKYHIDGIRVDAVASMLYLDYDREDGEWVPNQFGGNENLEAVDFLKQLKLPDLRLLPRCPLHCGRIHRLAPMCLAPPTSVAWASNFKWNMGWMHDMLHYFQQDPVHRKYHQNNITFSIWYAFSENFMLALSHDEVVHGKGNLFQKMPGDDWQKAGQFAIALRLHVHPTPAKKTLFMGMEFGQTSEWKLLAGPGLGPAE